MPQAKDIGNDPVAGLRHRPVADRRHRRGSRPAVHVILGRMFVS
jgi:hypothetical protein